MLYTPYISRVGQNRIYTYIYTVYLVISLPKIPYIHRIYMVLASPIYLVISLPKIPYIHRIYMVLVSPIYFVISLPKIPYGMYTVYT